MLIPFIIFSRAVGIYALITVPVLMSPPIYIISILYVVTYGWFAWALFTIITLAARQLSSQHHTRMLIMAIAVPVSVAFAFQMIEVFNSWDDVWHSGGFLAFPVVATIGGWISLFWTEKKIQENNAEIIQTIQEENIQ
jgi:hypothetical protein